MRTPYLLALDMGTSSIGYIAFSIDKNQQPTGILDLGVRVFPDGRDPKTKEPLAVSRRKARGLRRNRDRGQNRVRRLVRELIEFGLLPEEQKERKKVFDDICPYRARATAASREVDKYTLGRAIFHIGRRRGFKSNRLGGAEEETEFKSKIGDLREKLGDRTLGEYLYSRSLENEKLAKNKEPLKQKPYRFRSGKTDFYADRQMYLEEFEKIRQVQGDNHLNEQQWEALKETAFWQYPLKPVPKGKCRFYPEETRAHIDLPISHEYRIFTEVNALRYISQNVEHLLDERQRAFLYQYLDEHPSVTFKGLLKKKDLNKSPYFPSDATFNLDVGSRNGRLLGNKVMCEFRKPDMMGELADTLDKTEINDIIHVLIEPVKDVDGKNVVMETEDVEVWLKDKLPQLSNNQIKKICAYRFKRDTASVSRKFMAQINPVLRQTGLVYSDAVAQLENDQGVHFHHSDFETGEVVDKLPYYGKVMPESVWGDHLDSEKNKSPSERDEDAFQYGKIANPTVHIALNQLRVVVNRIIEKLGASPVKIHIELTRDLKNSKEARERIDKQIRENKKQNDRIRKFLEDELDIARPSREDFQKVKLWEELGKQGARYSVFSGRAISAAQLFNGEVEIEHIIPFSRCYDDGMTNKTLAFRAENHFKGNKTPHEAFSESTGGYDYHAIMKRALAAFGQTSKYERFKESAYEKFYGGERGDMIARQLNDTKYISRKARQYLACLCTLHNVISVNGMMTKILRDVWQLNNFKDRATGHYREDHRHHIVDAFVVGLTSRSLIQQLNTRRGTADQTPNDLYEFLKSRVKDIPKLKAELMEKLNFVIASYKPNRTSVGQIFDETAYGVHIDNYGKNLNVTRKEVTNLKHRDILEIRDNKIRSQLLQHLIGRPTIENLQEFKAKLPKESDLKTRLSEFATKAQIKRLRVNVNDQSVRQIASAAHKGYAVSEYAYCDVWMKPSKIDPKTGKRTYTYEGDFVAFADLRFYKDNPERGRPHPTAKKVAKLYKDDSLQLVNKKTGEVKYMRVVSYSNSRNKLNLRPNLSAVKTKKEEMSINTIYNENVVHKLRT